MTSQLGTYGTSLLNNNEVDPFVSAATPVSSRNINNSTASRNRNHSPPRTPNRNNVYFLTQARTSSAVANRALGIRTPTTDAMSPSSYGDEESRTSRSDRSRDSHDLIVGRNVTRDSLVHNMLLSFDQLSVASPSSTNRVHGMPSGVTRASIDGSSTYSTFDGNQDYSPAKAKGHAYSYSSDYDVATRSRASSQASGKGRRSNSTSAFQPELGRINSLRRDAPRGVNAADQLRHRRRSQESDSKSIDGGAAAALDDANDRSNSSPSIHSDLDTVETDQGIYPSPRTARKLHKVLGYAPDHHATSPTSSSVSYRDPIMDLGHQTDAGTPLFSAAQMIRQSVSGIASSRTSSVNTNSQMNNSSQPSQAADHRDHNMAVGPAKLKNKETRQTLNGPQPQSKERPGFFRRVFGSSSNKTVQASSLESDSIVHGSVQTVPTDVSRSEQHTSSSTKRTSSPMHSNSRNTSVPSTTSANTNKEQPVHTLVKKPSSFFRRRKKSVSDAPPLPSVPPKTAEQSANGHQEFFLRENPSSPDSSLRKVMNPYLSNSSPKRTSTPVNPNGQQNTASDAAQGPRSFSPDYTPDKSATIRSVSVTTDAINTTHEDLAASSRGLEQNIPSYYPPTSLQQTPELMRESIDRHRFSKSNVSNGSVKSRQGSERATTPTLPILERIARDMATVAEYERKFSKSAKIPSSATEESLRKHLVLSSVAQEVLNRDDWSAVADKKDNVVQDAEPDHEVTASDESFTRNDQGQPVAEESTIVADTPDVSMDTAVPTKVDEEKARNIFDGHEDFVTKAKTAAWLGDVDVAHQRTLVAYMRLFDFADLNILSTIRLLCGRLVLKAESQQVDRILEALTMRWCECNPNHGFKSQDVVHTICYSVLLLNTDLHLADIDSRMTKNQFVKNTMQTIVKLVADESPDTTEGRPTIIGNRSVTTDGEIPLVKQENNPPPVVRASTEWERPGGWRGSLMPLRRVVDSSDAAQKLSGLSYGTPNSDCGPLVKAPFNGTARAWEVQVEIVLKDFYASIKDDRLPLLETETERSTPLLQSQTSLQVFANGVLRRTPSVISKAPSEATSSRGRPGDNNMRTSTSKWNRKAQSRPRVYNSSTMTSSRTSIDDQSSAMWSPSMSSSTWSKPSFGKNHSSMSMDSSFGAATPSQEHQSIGFANAITQAIIREEVGSAGSLFDGSVKDGPRAMPLLEDESLGIYGAPWAKEGLVKFKHHYEAGERRAKNREWNDVFVVIEKGDLTLFSFTSKSIRAKSKNKSSQTVVGGGNWQDNAQNLGKFVLRQTIALALDGGYGKRPYVWQLTLPNGSAYLFEVGTLEILKEFVSTATYWSARLSNPPLSGGISNIEYGWSDEVVNNSLVAAINEQTGGGSPANGRPETAQSARPSLHTSIRESMDQGSLGNFRAKLPGDRLMIADWTPPSQSERSSNLLESDQLKLLSDHMYSIRLELEKHRALRSAMALAYTPRSNNSNKAIANWDRKNSHLIKEYAKYKTYVDVLHMADKKKTDIYEEREERRAEEERLREMVEEDDD